MKWSSSKRGRIVLQMPFFTNIPAAARATHGRGTFQGLSRCQNGLGFVSGATASLWLFTSNKWTESVPRCWEFSNSIQLIDLQWFLSWLVMTHSHVFSHGSVLFWPWWSCDTTKLLIATTIWVWLGGGLVDETRTSARYYWEQRNHPGINNSRPLSNDYSSKVQATALFAFRNLLGF